MQHLATAYLPHCSILVGWNGIYPVRVGESVQSPGYLDADLTRGICLDLLAARSTPQSTDTSSTAPPRSPRCIAIPLKLLAA